MNEIGDFILAFLSNLTLSLLQIRNPGVDEKLLGSTFSRGLHPCVKPTSKYKGLLFCCH